MRQKWRNAESAIRDACGLDVGPARPLSARMVGPNGTEGSWEDEATAAGYVFRALRPLSGAPIAALIARVAHATVPCGCRRPCCSGYRVNDLWKQAIEILAAAALTAGVCHRRYDIRRDILVSLYGQRRPFVKIAAELEISEASLARYAKEMKRWLGIGGIGIEPQAWVEATELLREAGLLEDAA